MNDVGSELAQNGAELQKRVRFLGLQGTAMWTLGSVINIAGLVSASWASVSNPVRKFQGRLLGKAAAGAVGLNQTSFKLTAAVVPQPARRVVA